MHQHIAQADVFSPSPLIRESFVALRVQCAGAGKHDGGVKVANDATDSGGCVDAGLCSSGSGLQCRQHIGHLIQRQTALTLSPRHTDLVTQARWPGQSQ